MKSLLDRLADALRHLIAKEDEFRHETGMTLPDPITRAVEAGRAALVEHARSTPVAAEAVAPELLDLANSFGFRPTGCIEVDRLLASIVAAGRAYGNVKSWLTSNAAQWIQKHADKCAEAIKNAEIVAALSIAEDKLWKLLPNDASYLDPPDGGDAPLIEQSRRMSDDARKWRNAMVIAAPPVELPGKTQADEIASELSVLPEVRTLTLRFDEDDWACVERAMIAIGTFYRSKPLAASLPGATAAADVTVAELVTAARNYIDVGADGFEEAEMAEARLERAIAAIADAPERIPGEHDLHAAVHALHETGVFRDEEGDATDQLEKLLTWVEGYNRAAKCALHDPEFWTG